MIQISSLFKKIKESLSSTELPKEILRSVVMEKTNIPIDNKEIDIKNKTAFVKKDPVSKSEIFINKKEILLSFAEKFGKDKITDIR